PARLLLRLPPVTDVIFQGMHKQLQTMTRASGDVGVGECQGSPNGSAIPAPNVLCMIPLRYAPVTTRAGYSDVRAGYMREKYFVPANIVMISKIPDVCVSKSPAAR